VWQRVIGSLQEKGTIRIRTLKMRKDLADWLEHLTAGARVATVWVRSQARSILRHRGIRGAADEAVLNIAHRKPGQNWVKKNIRSVLLDLATFISLLPYSVV
jgi:hypothetical protein